MKNPTRLLVGLLAVIALVYWVPRAFRPVHFLLATGDDELLHSASSIACPHLLERVKAMSERSRRAFRGELERAYFEKDKFDRGAFESSRQRFLAELLSWSGRGRLAAPSERVACLFRAYEATFTDVASTLEAFARLRVRFGEQTMAEIDTRLRALAASAPRDFDRAVENVLPSKERDAARARLAPFFTDLDALEKHLTAPEAVDRFLQIFRRLPLEQRVARLKTWFARGLEGKTQALVRLYPDYRAILVPALATRLEAPETGAVIEAVVPLKSEAEIELWKRYLKIANASAGAAFTKAFAASAKGDAELELAIGVLRGSLCDGEANGCEPLLTAWPSSEDPDEQREFEQATSKYLAHETEQRGLAAWLAVGRSLKPRVDAATFAKAKKIPEPRLQAVIDQLCASGLAGTPSRQLLRLVVESSCRATEGPPRDACLARLQADVWLAENRKWMEESANCRDHAANLGDRIRAARLAMEAPLGR